MRTSKKTIANRSRVLVFAFLVGFPSFSTAAAEEDFREFPEGTIYRFVLDQRSDIQPVEGGRFLRILSENERKETFERIIRKDRVQSITKKVGGLRRANDGDIQVRFLPFEDMQGISYIELIIDDKLMSMEEVIQMFSD
ncbi:MAG: hypothetical protein AAGJ81_12145 [Verrucomicrobiota bacterium]